MEVNVCGGEAHAELRGVQGWRPRPGREGAWAPKGRVLEHSLILLLLPDPVHGLPHWDVVQVKGTDRWRGAGHTLRGAAPEQCPFRERSDTEGVQAGRNVGPDPLSCTLSSDSRTWPAQQGGGGE